MKKAFRKSLKRQASLGTYFKNNNHGKSDNHHQSSSLSSAHSGTPILWQALAKKYRFNYPKDWYRIEAHWLDQIESFQEQPIDCPGRDGKMNNAITRISQCNESYQLCNSLPRSFIVPKDLKDVTLMDSMSTVIKDHRVPIISYCCPIEYRRNFIIRCASSDHQERVIETLSKAVKPLKVFNLSQIAPSFETTISAHKKLRDACRLKDEDQSSNYLSKTGKWLTIISQALKIVNETAKTLLSEASVILIEDDDSGWNSVVSSLIQVMLEPHRRTIEGFESLISKEWIYLSGGRANFSQPDILFTLFLDCTHQIYLQNTNEFEFTSEYLSYLFDAQYIFSPTSIGYQQHNQSHSPQSRNDDLKASSNYNNNNNEGTNVNSDLGKNVQQRTINGGGLTRSKTTYTYDEDADIAETELASYKPSSTSMTDLNSLLRDDPSARKTTPDQHDALESGYNMFMISPFYQPDKDRPILRVHDHIANIKLWSSLYLRWMMPNVKHGCVEEIIYFSMRPQQVDIITQGQNSRPQ